MKKKIILTLVIIFAAGRLFAASAFAEESDFIDITPFLAEELSDTDLSAWERFAENEYFEAVTGNGKSFSEYVTEYISGKRAFSFESLMRLIFDDLLSSLAAHRGVALLIFAVAVIAMLEEKLAKSCTSGKLAEALSFVLYAFAVILIIKSFTDIIGIGKGAIKTVADFTNAVFPVLSTLVNVAGADGSSTLLNPTLLIVAEIITNTVDTVIFPLITASFILNVISGISTYGAFGKLFESSKRLTDWIIGIMFVLFFGFIAIQRLTSTAIDTVTVKTVKYTISSFSIYGGSFLSRSFDLVSGCAVILKSVLGGLGMVILLTLTLQPAIKLLAISLVYRVLSLLLTVTGEEKISGLIDSTGRIYGTLFLLVVTVSILFFVIISVISVCGSAVFGI